MSISIAGVHGGPIEGVCVIPLRTIPDERGAIYHMLRSDDPHFEQFGEIYFSKAYPGVVKGWHIHSEMVLMYSAVVGMAKVVLYDERENSPTKGNIMEIFIGEENRLLVKVPPNVWNGFKAVGDMPVVIANCASIPHRTDEIKRLDPFENHIPYSWEVKQC